MLKRRLDVLRIYGGVYLGLLYAPLLVLPIFSFNDSIYIAFPLNGFTLKWYQSLLDNRALFEALLNSLVVGVGVALVSTILGTAGALALTRYRIRGQNAITALVVAPLVIPGIVFAVSLLLIFRRLLDFELSLWTIALGHMLLCLPFALLTMMSRLESVGRELEEASLNLGEGPWGTFWRVTFPIALPGIVSSLLLTFTVSFDEVILALFLHGKEVTLPVYIFGQLRFPTKLPAVLALGTCALTLSVALVLCAEVLRRKGVKS